MTHKLKIAVTGPTGYVGQRFLKTALMNGHQIVSLSRRPGGTLVSNWIKYDLGSREPLYLPPDIEVIVHLAANTSFKSELSECDEVDAAERIVNVAKDGGIKFIFISSQTARSDSPTPYGRIKFQIEQMVIDSGGLVIRPGLVYGGSQHGLYGELVMLVKKFYLLPCFLPAPRIQPIHVDDLAMGILKVAEFSPVNIGPIVMLGSASSISFNYFLGAIARHHLHAVRIHIPFPSIFIRLMAKVLVRIGGGLNRLNSLFNLIDMNTKSDLDLLDLNLRPLISGLNSSGSNMRRQLLLEGFAFQSYVVGVTIKKINMRNYVRIIERLRNGVSLQLPIWHQTWPFWVALLDNKKLKPYPWVKEFKWRLKAATLLAEASTDGAINFMGPIGSGFVSSFFGILTALLSDVFVKICRFFFAPFIQFIFYPHRKITTN